MRMNFDTKSRLMKAIASVNDTVYCLMFKYVPNFFFLNLPIYIPHA